MLFRSLGIRARLALTILGISRRGCDACGAPGPRYVCPDCQAFHCNACSRAGRRHGAEDVVISVSPLPQQVA